MRRTQLRAVVVAAGLVGAVLIGGGWATLGNYRMHVLLRHGGTWWTDVRADSPRLSPSMRLAIATAPVATPGPIIWTGVAEGFEVADLPAVVEGQAVDHLLLARINPRRFRFEVRTAPAGDKGLDQWMPELGAALVVNGSHFGHDGRPDTPIVSDGQQLGPSVYDARAGAFVTSPTFTGLRDLKVADWKPALVGAQNAMVSYPMLIAEGATRVPQPSRWLANRSFIGQDSDGRIIIGTTKDAFFSLDRLAHFLLDAQLNLTLVLNLDGGPVASQGIALNGFERRAYGRWEAQPDIDRVHLLTWPYGSVAMPVVLAVFPR